MEHTLSYIRRSTILMKVVKLLHNGRCVRMDVSFFPKDNGSGMAGFEKVTAAQ